MRSLSILLVAWLPAMLNCGGPSSAGGGPGDGPSIEAKLPLSADEELLVEETDGALIVRGRTFSYTISRSNGLLESVRVLNQEFMRGLNVPFPDMSVSSARDPRLLSYRAGYETDARCRIESSSPERVVVSASGGYHSAGGQVFPMRYHLRYEIFIDGVAFVNATNEATADLSYRWLVVNRGAVRRDLCRFYAHMDDLRDNPNSGGHSFRAMPSEDGTVLAGHFIPWIWLGNERTGVEISAWDMDSQRLGATEDWSRRRWGDPLGYSPFDSTETEGDPEVSMLVKRVDDRVVWHHFLVRNQLTFAKKGEKISYNFAFGVTPPKLFEPTFTDLREFHLGAHQMSSTWKEPTDERIAELAREGYDLLACGVNWRSGEYIPMNESATRRLVKTGHEYGLKFVPYTTCMDLNTETELFRDHGRDWAIEPAVEFNYQTYLMCPGASGWRDHWKRTIDRLVADYDFDGLYFDFWFGKLACENAVHGCGGRWRRATFPWLRDMLAHAYNRIKSEGSDRLVRANTNFLTMSMISSLVDVRLVGEARDFSEYDPLMSSGFYSSYRLGSATRLLARGNDWPIERLVSFGLLNGFLFPSTGLDERRQTAGNLRLIDRYWDAFDWFESRRAKWDLAIGGQELVSAGDARVRANVYRNPGLTLVAVWNERSGGLTTSLQLNDARALGLVEDRSYLVFDPIRDELLWDGPVAGRELRAFPLRLGPYGNRLLLIREAPGGGSQPALLAALGAKGRGRESWDGGAGMFSLSLPGVDGRRLEAAVFWPGDRPGGMEVKGSSVRYSWSESESIVRFSVELLAGASYNIHR